MGDLATVLNSHNIGRLLPKCTELGINKISDLSMLSTDEVKGMFADSIKPMELKKLTVIASQAFSKTGTAAAGETAPTPVGISHSEELETLGEEAAARFNSMEYDTSEEEMVTSFEADEEVLHEVVASGSGASLGRYLRARHSMRLPVAGNSSSSPDSSDGEDTLNCTGGSSFQSFTHRVKKIDDRLPLRNGLGIFFAHLHANPQVSLTVCNDIAKQLDILFKRSVYSSTVSTTAESPQFHFDDFTSNHKRMRYFKKNGSFIAPEPYVLGRRSENFTTRTGERHGVMVDSIAHKISLRKVLAKFFSLKNVLSETLRYLRYLNEMDSSNTVYHFVHGSSWKSRMTSHGNEIVMPLFLQVDDFDLSVLASHSGIHKMGAAYVSIPCLPPMWSSQLSNIFLTLLYHSSDRVAVGNEVVFRPLVEEFNFLKQTGLTFNLPDFQGTVYFHLGAILGDNLGLHSILGFDESFSSNSSCRICRVNKNIMHTQIEDDPALLRNSANYRSDVESGDVSLTGIKEPCTWLAIQNFDIFDHVGMGVMHDLSEGVMKYIMTDLLVHLIDKRKYFTIDILNDKIASFQFGPDTRDRPVSLVIDNLRRGDMGLTSSDMLEFCKYFGVMVGCYVPQFDEYWEIYVILMEVLDMVLTARGFPKPRAHALRGYISHLCQMYISLFKTKLNPKFHLLLHYPNAVLKFGPLRHLSSMRLEAKHRPCKIKSKSTMNRQNLTYTVAKRHQLTLNEIFLTGYLPCHITSGAACNVSPVIAAELSANIPFINVNSIQVVNWVKIGSTVFKPGSVVPKNVTGDLTTFTEIKSVFLDKDEMKVYFSGESFKTISFERHFYAYRITSSNDSKGKYFPYDTLECPYPCTVTPFTYNDESVLLVVLGRPA